MALVDNMDIFSGLHRGEGKCLGPEPNDANPWISKLGGDPEAAQARGQLGGEAC